MKGLIYKDLCMLRAYLRSYIFIIVVFGALAVFSNSTFFLIYPFLFVSTIPMSLMSNDNASGWNSYSATMPYSKAQLVSAKYIDALLVLGAILIMSGLTLGISMLYTGAFSAEVLFSVLALGFSVALFNSAILLPCLYKFDVEKGRIAYYITLIVQFALIFSLLSVAGQSVWGLTEIINSLSYAVICALFALIYLLSWRISVAICEKREG